MEDLLWEAALTIKNWALWILLYCAIINRINFPLRIRTSMHLEEACRLFSSNNKTWTSITSQMATSLATSQTTASPTTAMESESTRRLAQFTQTMFRWMCLTRASQGSRRLRTSLATTRCLISRTKWTNFQSSLTSTFLGRPRPREALAQTCRALDPVPSSRDSSESYAHRISHRMCTLSDCFATRIE